MSRYKEKETGLEREKDRKSGKEPRETLVHLLSLSLYIVNLSCMISVLRQDS